MGRGKAAEILPMTRFLPHFQPARMCFISFAPLSLEPKCIASQEVCPYPLAVKGVCKETEARRPSINCCLSATSSSFFLSFVILSWASANHIFHLAPRWVLPVGKGSQEAVKLKELSCLWNPGMVLHVDCDTCF